jgi:lipopolysaccharide transport system ATP-binding protein
MSADPVITVEGLSKCYRIGTAAERADTLADMLTGWIRAPLRNWRYLWRLRHFAEDDEGDDVLWALRDASFTVRQGEILGIIGRNGAGKSTLLKVLARITEPTRGRAVIRGRVASLLEVGTGFHPELTGRENIYLNGTILGMSKAAIDRQFDDIVAFSEVSRFIDTPIKRYSSGMRVRLAFAVAAHLDPEVLIIDEVLAVGDIGFQRKCLGKMGDLAQSGRTVLLVSHNMGAVRNLCERVLLISDGRIVVDDTADNAIYAYHDECRPPDNDTPQQWHRHGDGRILVEQARLLDGNGRQADQFIAGQPLVVELRYRNVDDVRACRASLSIRNELGDVVSTFNMRLTGVGQFSPTAEGVLRCTIPNLPLPLGQYSVSSHLVGDHKASDTISELLGFHVGDSVFYGTGAAPKSSEADCLIAHDWAHDGQAMVGDVTASMSAGPSL